MDFFSLKMRKTKCKSSGSSTCSEINENTQKLNLKREIGLVSAVSLLAGTMIGSGIFMSPQWVLYHIGSPGGSLIIWAACGLLAMLGSLSYAELGTVIKESGGDYIYILRTSGPLPAFLLAFTSMLVVRPASIAGIALSFAEYAVAPFYQGCPLPELVVKFVAASCILLLAIANCLNVRWSMSIQVFFMAAKLISLVVIIIGGVVMLINGHTSSFQNAFQGTIVGINPIGIAFYQGLWSYDGWNNLNYVTEELKRPEVNLPRAIMIAIPLVTVLYLLVNISYLAVMTPTELMSSSAVAATWGNKVLGSWSWLMSVAAALSSFGSLNGTFFSGGRVCYVAAREGHMPDILSMAHVRRLTPSPALIFTTALSLLVLIPGNFKSIVNFFSFTAWFFYAITLSGLLYLKLKKRHLPNSYEVPIVIPIIVIIAAVFLVLAPIIDDPKIEYLYVSLFILSGVMFYIPFVHFKLCPNLLTKATVFLQLFLEVAPTEKNTD
ncbi:b(0,+)-type amino acid transporter 1 [Polyodon spathula]|uniref:b(0,+)-type amino acid transporter 1 n=1 Tax=Polyodon spathula TaxID=7913 RepID=UPI001B7DE71B|nr:b(0,+)-type amino acid transporter 1 [Polyodon spathula]